MQVAVLANIPDQPQPGDSASEDDIGEELQACLAGNEEADSASVKPVSALPYLALRLVVCVTAVWSSRVYTVFYLFLLIRCCKRCLLVVTNTSCAWLSLRGGLLYL